MDVSAIQKPGEIVRPGELNIESIRNLVERLYGLNVIECTELASYDDRNYYLNVTLDENTSTSRYSSPTPYVLKITNAKLSAKQHYIEAVNLLITHLRQNGLSVTCPIPNKLNTLYTLEHNIDGSGDILAVRLFDYMSGKIINKFPYDSELLYDVGKFVGRMDRVLQDFDHSFYASHKIIWDMTNVPLLKNYLHIISDDDDKILVSNVIEAFEQYVVLQYGNLRKGIIHGDTSEQNIICKKINERIHVVGIIDFGDSCLSYVIFDLAILIAYMMLDSHVLDFLDVGMCVIQGYLSEYNLTTTEIDVLPIVVAARLVQSLVMGLNAYQSQPSNSYLNTSLTKSLKCLKRLWSFQSTTVIQHWFKQ